MLAEAAHASAVTAGSVHVHAVAVRRFEQVEATMEAIWPEHGPLTGVVNNATANFIAPTHGLSPAP